MSGPAGYLCPSCQSPLEHAAGARNLLRCPQCGQQSFAPGEAENAPADNEAPAPPASHDLLNSKRIRSVALARRAAYRARSWCIIAAILCAAIVIQLIWMIVQAVHHRGWSLQCTGYAIFAALAAAGTIFFATRASVFHRQAKESESRRNADSVPTTPPDFSTLDNGSKQAKNLEDVR